MPVTRTIEDEYSLRFLAEQLDLWRPIADAVHGLLATNQAEKLLIEISTLPVRPSRATRTLGTYASRAGAPRCIRLQFALEADLLKETFLHEVAHLCDHLINQSGRPYRQAHGAGWKSWAVALGIEAAVRGQSEALAELYRQKLRTVAVCRRCGIELQRARRFNRQRTYVHRHCGGRLDLL
ncbi:MAG TPA: SprT-like domain-containing protein [Geopsychrobacteraceae bacterium]|nr:SprT-like domain-containing protein [Geopsychrobacteraceae bacterium]